MSHALVDPPTPPLLDEQTARANADALHRVAAEYGITALRFASPGRLVGHMDDDRDMGDMVDFQLAVEDLLDRYIDLFTDRVLSHPHASPDLVAARPL
ncbi:MAG: hypothetical protein ACRDNS_19220 [Trebonia sp.]